MNDDAPTESLHLNTNTLTAVPVLADSRDSKPSTRQCGEVRESNVVHHAEPDLGEDSRGGSQFPLMLRWRNPRPTVLPECENTAPGYVNPFDMTSLDVLIKTYRLTISSKTRDNWRWCYPNRGYLRGFEDVFGGVFIHATDGLLAYFRVDDSGSLFLGHLSNFVGPVAKEFVWEDDWNWETNKRAVNVFKRTDGSIVVIPKDTTMDIHWSKCPRISKEEFDIYASLGSGRNLQEMLNALDHLGKEPAKKVTFRDGKTKSKRQQLLDSL